MILNVLAIKSQTPMNRFLILALFTMLCSCELTDGNSKKYQLEEIEELYSEIVALSESVPCTNSSEWSYTPIGSKACGGPTGYIAYSQSIAEEFLDLVEQYTNLQSEYNKKHNVVSDCALVSPPRNVVCEGGKAFLIN